MEKLLGLILKHRIFVLLACLAVITAGIISWNSIKIDAFPDVTNVQVMIITSADGLAPDEIERLITYPIEVEMSGLPDVKQVRSTSKAGLSQVVIVFKDSVNIYFARQLVFEKLAAAKENMPEGYEPELGPVSTGLGEIFQYTLEGKEAGLNAMELRTIQDWVITPKLRTVPGITEVNSFGGFVKQYQVVIDPDMLKKYGIALSEVVSAIENNNATAPAKFIVTGGEQIVARSTGLIKNTGDIKNIVVSVKGTRPVFVGDVAEIMVGHQSRQGAVTRDGQGETVCGMAIMLRGENSKNVVDRVKKKLIEIQERLPEGVKISPFYDRTALINECIKTMSDALFQGGALVVIVLLVFLGNLRLSLIVFLSLPIAALITFIVMRATGLSANLMSLGGLAIALGMIADANIVVGENILRHLSQKNEGEQKLEVVFNAVKEVAAPVLFSILIIILVFFPLFSLQDIEGKMFKPLALSIMFTMAGSLIISLTVTPVLSSFFIKENEKHKENMALSAVRKIYQPVLDWALENRKKTAVIAAAALLLSLIGIKFIGTEFLPYLDEGSLAINVVKFPTSSLDGSKEIGGKIEKILIEFPEVETVITKTGRAEIAEDPMGPEQNDIFVMLKERKHWKTRSKKELIVQMEKKLAVIPGIRLNFSQPIALRVNELISGVKSDVAVKLSGYDLKVLGENAEKIVRELSEIKGAADVKMEQSAGLLQLDIDIDREAIARYGLNVSDVNSVVEAAVGGKVVTTVYEGDKRISVQVRYPEDSRSTEKAIRDISVMTPAGQWISLAQLAQIGLKEVPAQISRENGSRRVIVECNVRGRDIGGFVKEAKEKIRGIEKSLPENYFISWGGQFENQERAMKTLTIVVPAVILLIFLMLFTVFGSFKPAALVILNLPFAFVGGIMAVLLFRLTLSVSAVVGFIVLFGIAVQNGVVLVSFINQLRKEGMTVLEAVKKACELRLRPLLLTTLSAMVGLVPLLWSSGAGADIQKPLAVVVLGGLISSWILTLVVLPALYSWFEEEVVEY